MRQGRIGLWTGFFLATALVAGCQDATTVSSTRHLAPVPPATVALMSAKDMDKDAPILVRSYKKESEMEIWKQTKSGRYALLKTYPICRWSGQLGPKVQEGDRQAPEGFYTVGYGQMNPNSNYYLSFDTGYPNALDRALGRSGGNLMVHGACSSRGCFSMTDETVAEIYAVARDALKGGQQRFQFQSFPFRMTAENLAKHRADPNMPFWRNLKEGSDHFEVTHQEPKVAFCGRHYVFDTAAANPSISLDPSVACPALKMDETLAAAVNRKQAEDQAQVASLVAKGTPAIRLVYEDGDQHPSFKQTLTAKEDDRGGFSFMPRTVSRDVSRPEALASGPREIVIDTLANLQTPVKPFTLDGKAKTPAPVKTQVSDQIRPAIVDGLRRADTSSASKPMSLALKTGEPASR